MRGRGQPAGGAERRSFEYRYEGVTFTKILGPGQQISLLMNGRPLTLEQWNHEINKRQPMALKESHRNPLIRLIERRRRRLTADRCRPRAEEQWIDLGCETGFISEAVASRCGRLLCVDIDPRLLELARQRLADRRNTGYLCAPVDDLSQIPAGSADGVLAAEIMEHLVDVDSFLREVHRVLRPGGRLIITVPNDQLVLRIKRLLRAVGGRRLLAGLSDALAIGHLRLFDRRSLRRAVGARFAIDAVGLPFPFLNYFVSAHKP